MDRVCVRAISVSVRAILQSERCKLVVLFRRVTSSGSRVVSFHLVVQMDLRIRACLMEELEIARRLTAARSGSASCDAHRHPAYCCPA